MENTRNIAQTIFQLLLSSSCMLENLDFSHNHNFGNEVLVYLINSLTAKFVLAGAKLALFCRYMVNFYVGIDK